MRIALTLYIAGVVIGLLTTDDRWPRRLVVALAWPLGPLAFAIVVPGLLLVAIGLWPKVLLPIAAVIAAGVYWLTNL